jgi:mannose-6-phosphate isomerase-like protein (cupin superfamily)
MNNLNFLLDKDNVERYKNQTPFKFDKNIPFEISWDEIFALVDEDIKNLIKTNQDYYKGYGFKLKKADRLEPIAQIIDILFTIFNPSKIAKNTRPSDAQHIYINFTTDQSLNNAPHLDKDHVFFWQLQGKTRWEIYDDNNEKVQYTFNLYPGDMIYCPKHRKHRVISLTPRAGASIGFNSLR